eukprot:619146-Pyramimonas_sp.AAC.1
MLSAQMRTFAYNTEQPVAPPQSVLENYDSVLRGVCIRTTSKQIAGNSGGAQLAFTGAGSAGAQLANDPLALLQSLSLIHISEPTRPEPI